MKINGTNHAFSENKTNFSEKTYCVITALHLR